MTKQVYLHDVLVFSCVTFLIKKKKSYRSVHTLVFRQSLRTQTHGEQCNAHRIRHRLPLRAVSQLHTPTNTTRIEIFNITSLFLKINIRVFFWNIINISIRNQLTSSKHDVGCRIKKKNCIKVDYSKVIPNSFCYQLQT